MWSTFEGQNCCLYIRYAVYVFRNKKNAIFDQIWVSGLYYVKFDFHDGHLIFAPFGPHDLEI